LGLKWLVVIAESNEVLKILLKSAFSPRLQEKKGMLNENKAT
jgi:hypothetical protein